MELSENADTDPLAKAGQQLQDFTNGPARQAAEQLEQMFARTGLQIGREMEKAARAGSLSFQGMVTSILKDLARLAIKQAVGGVLSSVLGQAGGGGSFSGARAEGGPVVSGGAYLVGERGPELFRPASTGTIETAAAPTSVTVNFHLGSNANMDEFRRSQGQISTLLSRAVAQGSKRL
jgi:phage-related minor tail protein